MEAEPDLHARDTTMAVVSRAPIAKLERFKASKGWTFPWYSSYGGDFNYDSQVTLDERVAPVERPFGSSQSSWRPSAVMSR